jgi:putative ABC transport system permease protein
MLKNYLKIGFRNLKKQKLYSMINIFGLSLGMVCCILIYLFVRFEFSYDRFHEKGDRIYRIVNVDYETADASESESPFFDTRAPEGARKSASLPLPLGPVLKELYPEIREIVRYGEVEALLRNENIVFKESVTYVDASFFEVFSFQLPEGNPSTALSGKNNVILTPAIAQKYFGDEHSVGKTLRIKIRDKEDDFTVTGIAAPAPASSSIQYQVLLPIEHKPFYDVHIENWRSFNTSLFIELNPGTDPDHLESNLNEFYAERYKDSMDQARTRKNLPDDSKVSELQITPVTNIHLDASVPWPGGSNPIYSYILSGIVVLILLIACINYVTLALTRSAGRVREVGIRKAAGAQRRQIAMQFWGETQLTTLFALATGLGLAELFLPVFNGLSGKSLAINYSGDAGFLLLLLALASLTGLIAGSYPALFLARFHPTEVLKGLNQLRFKPRLTKGLLILQYSLSVFLVIGSVIMYRQMDFVSKKDLGYDEDQVVVVPTHTGWSEEGTRLMQRYRNELRNIPGVVEVSGMAPAFTDGWNRYGFSVAGEDKDAFIYYVDAHFINTMGMELVAGRNFSEDSPSERTDAVIINQALAVSMGWEDPVGELLPWKGAEHPSEVIGVVKDFHFQSLEAPIQPMVLHMDPEHGGINSILIKIEDGMIAETLPRLKQAWSTTAPLSPFDYWFLDDAVAQQYESYSRWMRIMSYATIFAIFISCMGLFGMAGIATVNRTKEIGIRKILGATVFAILMLLSKDFIKLVLIATLIASPVGYYIMNRWLADFTYRIDMSWWIFTLAGVLMLCIAIGAVWIKAAGAALSNPVKSLRYE